MSELPDDVEALKQLVREAEHAKRDLTALLEERDTQLRTLRLRITALEQAQTHRAEARGGAAASQLEFSLGDREGLATAPATPEASVARTAPGTGKGRIFTLPLMEVRHEPTVAGNPPLCANCLQSLQPHGQDVSQMLDYAHGAFQMTRHVRPKLYCSACRQIIQAPPVPRPIARALAGPGVLAHLLMAKYALRVPLYRQQQIYAAAGVPIDRSTLADWLEASWLLLEPLADALARYVLAAAELQVAVAPYPIRAHGTGRIRIGSMTIYLREEHAGGSPAAVWFRFGAAGRATRTTALRQGSDLGERGAVTESAAAQRILVETLGTRAAARGSDANGARAAGIFGLIATARLSALDPEQYLRRVFESIGTLPLQRMEELLPWSIALDRA